MHGSREAALDEPNDLAAVVATADLPHLVEWFHRGGNVAGIGGTGIGLAAAHEIVTAHGGTIGVDSTEVHGTTATVRLPLAPPTDGLMPPMAAATPRPSADAGTVSALHRLPPAQGDLFIPPSP